MGKVFTHTEIDTLQIPREEDYARLNNALRASATGQCAALLIGSTARALAKGKPCTNLRSDIDCVVIFDDGRSHREILECFLHCGELADELNIPLSILPYKESWVLDGTSDVGPGFGKHVRKCARPESLIGGEWNPDYFASSAVSVRTEAHMYLSRKRGALMKRAHVALDEVEAARYYTKLMEAPAHAARRLLDCVGDGIVGNDDETFVLDSFSQVFPGEASRFLGFASRLNHEYTEFIHRISGGSINRHERDRAKARFAYQFQELRFSVPDFLTKCIELLGHQE